MNSLDERNYQQNRQDTAEPVDPSSFYQIVQYPQEGLCNQLTGVLIRPPRFTYDPILIRPNVHKEERYTFRTVNVGFEMTIYQQDPTNYMVLYLHGNGSSRVQGSLLLRYLPEGVGLACFDFNGCGNRNESQYITLGQNQSIEVDIAARYLKQEGYQVVGWGRSMGGVSLLKSKEIDIMVSDSAYSNLTNLCKQSTSKFVPSPCCCIFYACFPCIFSCIKSKVQSRSGLKIENMDVAGHLSKISKQNSKKAILFIHGENDTLVPASHAQILHDAFNGKKKILLFNGSHNGSRPRSVINRCFQFIQQCLSESQKLPKNNKKLNQMQQLQSINATFPTLKKEQRSKQARPTIIHIRNKLNSTDHERSMTGSNLNTEQPLGASDAKLLPEEAHEQSEDTSGKIKLAFSDDPSQKQAKYPNSFAQAAQQSESESQKNKNLNQYLKQHQTFKRIFNHQ